MKKLVIFSHIIEYTAAAVCLGCIKYNFQFRSEVNFNYNKKRSLILSKSYKTYLAFSSNSINQVSVFLCNRKWKEKCFFSHLKYAEEVEERNLIDYHKPEEYPPILCRMKRNICRIKITWYYFYAVDADEINMVSIITLSVSNSSCRRGSRHILDRSNDHAWCYVVLHMDFSRLRWFFFVIISIITY